MVPIDTAAPLHFLSRAFEPTDCAAIFLKSYETKSVVQRVGSVSWFQSPPFQRWLRAMNARKFNIFVSVNAIAPGRRSRTRDAIAAVRHVFLDADDDGTAVLERVKARADLPDPSYVLHSSPNHVHIFWRVAGFQHALVEQLQRQLARELRTDPAATPVTQTTRLAGFFNHKRTPPHLVTVEYRDIDTRYTPEDFPAVNSAFQSEQAPRSNVPQFQGAVSDRVRRYLDSVPPAVAGQHGDIHTFRLCCRLVRGFALSEAQALEVLSDWNARCQPPWSVDELRDKLRRAAQYGREPVGGLL